MRVGQAKSAQLDSDVTPYLAMEFIDGSSLAEQAAPGRRRTKEAKRRVTMEFDATLDPRDRQP